jgi:hypothetical protein
LRPFASSGYGGDLVAVVEDRRVSELDTSDGLVA